MYGSISECEFWICAKGLDASVLSLGSNEGGGGACIDVVIEVA